MTQASFTIGVEEEYFVVDAESRALRPRAEVVLADARRSAGERVEPEMNLAQVESSTPVCTTLEDVHGHLCTLRTTLMRAAERNGSRIAALGTHPFSDWIGQQITPNERYEQLDADYAQLAWEQLVCGCHVHVAVEDQDLAIQVMNYLRPDLPTLRALTTNSPFWRGIDTGYASYRMTLFDRWPTTGTPPVLADRRAYEDLVDTLVATETVADASKLYWDVRPSLKYPTLEFRVGDVCLTVDEAAMLAGLARSMVRTAVAAVRDGVAAPVPSQELLRSARWRAARYGTQGSLIDTLAPASRPAAVVVGSLLERLRPDLQRHGEWGFVNDVIARILSTGTGSDRQRDVLAGGDFLNVVDMAVEQTVAGG